MNLFSPLVTKIAAGAVVALLVMNAAQYVQNRLLKADLKEADAALIVAASINQTNVDTIKGLRSANQSWAEAEELKKIELAKLKKDAEDATRNAERAQRELASRRELDRRSPDCAALLDRSLAVCPDVVRRLRERQIALGTHRDD